MSPGSSAAASNGRGSSCCSSGSNLAEGVAAAAAGGLLVDVGLGESSSSKVAAGAGIDAGRRRKPRELL